MDNSGKVILVTGATGRQGGAVVRHMRPKGWKLRALTSNPGCPGAQDLARQGIEIVQGDLEGPEIARASRRAPTAFTACRTSGRWAQSAK